MLPWLVRQSPAQPYRQVEAVSIGCNDCVGRFKKKKACLIGVYFQAELCYNIVK